MASKGTKVKILPKRRKARLFGIISFFVVLLIAGINIAYAYYSDSDSLSILANLIADFDFGDGDVNLMIYKEVETDSNLYSRSYSVPSIGYTFNETLVKCTKPCENNPKRRCAIACGTDPDSDCYYSYNSEEKSFNLTSNQKVTCKFYFEKDSNSDINVYIMKEDLAGEYTYNSKNYSLIEVVPAYGYKYVNYKCDSEVESFEYDSALRKFKVSTTTKNTCYAYFDDVSDSDIQVNVYTQHSVGSSIYDAVQTIPVNNLYILSSNHTSACYDSSGNIVSGSSLDYYDGYIDIAAPSKSVCNVYLDLVE